MAEGPSAGRAERPRKLTQEQSSLDPAVRLLWQIAVFVAIVASWEGLVAWEILPRFSVGSPSAIAAWYRDNFLTPRLLVNLMVTLREAFAGLVAGVAVGVIGAFLLARFERVHQVLKPFIMVTYSVPRLALAPLFILWFGLGEASKVALSFTLVVFVVFFATYAGVTSVEQKLVDAFRTMGASRRFIYWHVVLPHSLPHIFSAVRISIGLSLVVVIAGEFIAGSSGLGYLIVRSANLFYINEVMGLIVLLGLLALALELLLSGLERRLFVWRRRPTL